MGILNRDPEPSELLVTGKDLFNWSTAFVDTDLRLDDIFVLYHKNMCADIDFEFMIRTEVGFRTRHP